MLETIVGSPTGGPDERRGLADRRIKPALLTLLVDQAKLIDASSVDDGPEYDLRGGFPHRRALIEWYQRASVRTLGHIADLWPPTDCINDEPLQAALIRSPLTEVEPMAEDSARRYRQMLEARVVQPACNDAYVDLRPAAADYVKAPDEDGRDTNLADLDPKGQAHIAMRPGFRTLDNQQHRALEELWGGFESEDDLLDWLHSLNSPTNGEVDSELPYAVLGDDVALRYLLHEPEGGVARNYREVLAIVELLPAFVAGVKAAEASELAKAASTGPTTFKMEGGA